MKIKRCISKVVISMFLFNNIMPISNASTQDDIERYEVLSGDKVLISDVMNTHEGEVSISGNTLVNIFTGFSSLTNNDSVYSSYQDNAVTLQAQNGFVGNIGQNYLGTPNLSKSIVQAYTYTLYFNSNIEGARFGLVGLDVDGNEVGSEYSVITKSGANKLVFKVDSNISSVKEFRFKLFDTSSNEAHIFSDIVLLEGSYNYESLSYFEGVLSSGDLNSSEIVITNENQSDTNNFIDSISLSLDTPLRGLPNGNRDKIVEIDGELFIERNTKQVVIDGKDTTKFRYNYVGGSSIAAFHLSISGDDTKKGRDNMEVQCDRFPTSKVDYRSRKHNSIAIHPDTSSGLSGSIEVALLETPDRAGLIKYFQDNPTTIVYALKTPVYEHLNIKTPLKINLFEGENLVYSDSIVPLHLSVVVDRLLNISQELVRIAKENPTIENITRARCWVNLIEESTFKDVIQDDLNTVTGAIDFQVERKSSSVNTDVYIKMKNTLSLSLDTNYITFEDYSGVEAIEKSNAINLSVQSSLPYLVNVSLEDEIRNSDNSAIINKSALNIKANSDDEYKTFSSIGTPISLINNTSYNTNEKHGIDIRIDGNETIKPDVYKTVLKFEAIQK